MVASALRGVPPSSRGPRAPSRSEGSYGLRAVGRRTTKVLHPCSELPLEAYRWHPIRLVSAVFEHTSRRRAREQEPSPCSKNRVTLTSTVVDCRHVLRGIDAPNFEVR